MQMGEDVRLMLECGSASSVISFLSGRIKQTLPEHIQKYHWFQTPPRLRGSNAGTRHPLMRQRIKRQETAIFFQVIFLLTPKLEFR